MLLDILTEDATWLAWSSAALATAADRGPLYLNPMMRLNGPTFPTIRLISPQD